MTVRPAAIVLLLVTLSVPGHAAVRAPASPSATEAGARASASPSASADWRAQVEDLLRRRALAVESGDEAAFRDTMRFAPQWFRRARLAAMRRLRTLPLERYTLTYADPGYHDLADALETRPRADEVHVVQVTERLALRGYDQLPTADDLFLTVARRGATWSVVSDQDLTDLGLLTARSLWDFGDVSFVEGGGVIVIHHGRPAVARRILAATREAIAHVRARWPYRWPAKAVVMIPRSSGELSRILQTTFDLGPFVAFAGSSVERPGGEYRLGGHRVYVQPATFFSTSAEFQADTLSHEMLHVATRGLAGAFTPAWLDEGVAQIYGERAAPAVDALVRGVRARTFAGLPDDWMFTVVPRDEIHLSYQTSAAFVSELRRRFGREAGARLYRAMSRESPVSFGTARYHLDRAARAAFGRSIDDLERRWLRRLEEEIRR